MSDRPALEVAKKLNEKIEGFVGYSRSHHDIGLELMRAAQSACTAIEQLSDTVESLQRENEELRRIASEKHDEVLALEAAAITPEMREMIDNALDPDHEDCISTSSEPAHDAVNLLLRLRDLLNTGGEG